MNYRGSSRHLVRNAKSALLAAIEIYNKPGIQYRDENFIILLLNAWELCLKALISRNGQSIYYPKARKQPYRTISLVDALLRAEPFFPKKFGFLPVKENLTLLATYRDNAVHFYNEPDFGVLVYSLAQTSIVNLKDLLYEAFDIKLERDITWQLMPLGLRPPIDPIAYISKASKHGVKQKSATKQFLAALTESYQSVETGGGDTGRLLTVFHVRLESVKKLEKSDLVVGVAGGAPSEEVGPMLVTRLRDPNVTHPLRQKDVLSSLGTLHGIPITSHTFQALAHKYGYKKEPRFCWRSMEGVLTRYSHDLTQQIKNLSKVEIEAAVAEYREVSRRRPKHIVRPFPRPPEGRTL